MKYFGWRCQLSRTPAGLVWMKLLAVRGRLLAQADIVASPRFRPAAQAAAF